MPTPRLLQLACAFLLPASAAPALAQTPHSLLETDPLPPSARLELRLDAGGYTIRTSPDNRIHVSEVRPADSNARSTDIRFRTTGNGAHLEIDPPHGGKNGPEITIALPGCASLDLTLSAGELVFDTVPCGNTDASIHAGEIRATLADPEAFRSINASVSIGEVDAPGMGKSREDEEHGGFFRSFHRQGSGTRIFTAHVGTGQITLSRPHA